MYILLGIYNLHDAMRLVMRMEYNHSIGRQGEQYFDTEHDSIFMCLLIIISDVNLLILAILPRIRSGQIIQRLLFTDALLQS